jgi:hypothetical protein
MMKNANLAYFSELYRRMMAPYIANIEGVVAPFIKIAGEGGMDYAERPKSFG